MLKLKILEYPVLKKLVTGLFLANILAFILAWYFISTPSISYILPILLITILMNGAGFIYALHFTTTELLNLSEKIAKATNGTLEWEAQQYDEGILCGLEYQFGNLFQRLARQNYLLNAEKD